jgi:hypothetical protein
MGKEPFRILHMGCGPNARHWYHYMGDYEMKKVMRTTIEKDTAVFQWAGEVDHYIPWLEWEANYKDRIRKLEQKTDTLESRVREQERLIITLAEQAFPCIYRRVDDFVPVYGAETTRVHTCGFIESATPNRATILISDCLTCKRRTPYDSN